MAQHKLEFRIRVFGENPIDPVTIDASPHHRERAAHVHRVDADPDDQQIASPFEPGQAFLALRAVLRDLVKHLSPDSLTDRCHRVVIAGDPEHRNIQIGERLHLSRQLDRPFLAEGFPIVVWAMIPGQAPNEITQKTDELWTWVELVHDPVYGRKMLFVTTPRFWRTYAAISIGHKVTSRLGARQQRPQSLGFAHPEIPHTVMALET